MSKKRLLINLNTHNCTRSVTPANGREESPYAEFSPRLESSEPLVIGDNKTTLGKLAHILINHESGELENNFKERGQFIIGKYLFNQLFENLPNSDVNFNGDESPALDIHIITEDEQFLMLPWSLLNNNGNFLAATGCTINFSPPFAKWTDANISPSPRILVAVPEPRDQKETGAEAHLREIRNILSQHTFNNEIYIVKTWDEFRSKISTVKPHFLYYYGHGESSEGTSQLLFEHSDTFVSEKVSASEFANCLRELKSDTPALVYVNCCSGDGGGVLGIGKQLREFVPAVITNCSKIMVSVAQHQAREIWNSLLINRLPPHEAVASLRKQFAKTPGELSAVRWLLPVIHCGYTSWRFSPITIDDEVEIDWKNKLDRDMPVALAKHFTEMMLKEEQQRVLALLWFGQEGQGIEKFYDRLISEMKSNRWLPHRIHEVFPNWNPHLDNFYEVARNMMAEAFKVNDFRNIAEEVRIISKKNRSERMIIYVRHSSLTEEMHLSKPSNLARYLRWLNDEFAQLLEGQIFAIVGLPNIVKESLKFRSDIEAMQLDLLENVSFHLLDELSGLRDKDLLRFLIKNKRQLRNDERSAVLRYIMSVTDGEYEKVLIELNQLLTDHLDYLDKIELHPNRDKFFN